MPNVLTTDTPVQADWVVLQRFTGMEAALGWLKSDDRLRRLAEVQPMLVGRDDIHLVSDGASGVLPAPVSTVISTRVRPGQEAAYRAWEQRMAAVQSRAAGFQGYRFEAPIPGVQEDWLAILRFDSEANMQAWLDSPERAAMLKEAEGFTEEFHARTVRTGFDQWFAANAGPPPAAWKQNMVVLLLLYPVVFLFGAYVQTPLLMGWAKLPFAVALFVSNAVSVVLLSWLVPLACGRLGWWLRPGPAWVQAAGAGAILLLYAAMIAAFTWS